MSIKISIDRQSHGVTVSITTSNSNDESGAGGTERTSTGGGGGTEKTTTGGGGTERTSTGGGASSEPFGVSVIGPIVLSGGTYVDKPSAPAESGSAISSGTGAATGSTGTGGTERTSSGGGGSRIGSDLVVVGPIVVCETSSTGVETGEPITGTGRKPRVEGNATSEEREIPRFSGQKQQQDKWCWAAVSVSVAHEFLPSSNWTQCKVASRVLGLSKCCSTPSACNSPQRLEDALKAVGCWRETFEEPLDFSKVQDEINADRPVCARIGWREGGGHFVVIYGYRVSQNGVRQVIVADPFFADSTVALEAFQKAYLSGIQPGGGEWTHTYLVQN